MNPKFRKLIERAISIPNKTPVATLEEREALEKIIKEFPSFTFLEEGSEEFKKEMDKFVRVLELLASYEDDETPPSDIYLNSGFTPAAFEFVCLLWVEFEKQAGEYPYTFDGDEAIDFKINEETKKEQSHLTIVKGEDINA